MVLLLGCTSIFAEPKISILISTPRQDNPYSIYGHASLRIADPDREIDEVYNYGVFNLRDQGFVYEFMKGTSESYLLEVVPTESYIPYYLYTGADIYEIVLNLPSNSIQKIIAQLTKDLLPENRAYRYSYAFNNCATRLWDIIQASLPRGTEIHLPKETESISWRKLINSYAELWPWYQLGTDLALGSGLDQKIATEQKLFLPIEMHRLLSQATIQTGDKIEPLVVRHKTYNHIEEDANVQPPPWLLRPLMVTLIIATLLAFLFQGPTWVQRTSYTLLYSVVSLLGIVLFFLTFISEQPFTSYNWNILVLHPLHLIALLGVWQTKRLRKLVTLYHWGNMIAIFLWLIIVIFGVQTPPASMGITGFILLIASRYFFRAKRLTRKK